MIEVIVIGVVALAVLGLVTFLVVKTFGAKDDAMAARDLYEKQREATDEVIRDRGNLTALLAGEREKTKTLQDRLTVAESERNDATRALAAKVGKAIQDAPDAASALDALNELLASPLPGSGSTTAQGGNREATAVQPATAADPGKAGGHA